MEFTPALPERTPNKPLSNSARAFTNSSHPLLTIGGKNSIRVQFTISTWLTTGACLQSLLLLLPIPLIYKVLPSFVLLSCKIINTYLILYGFKPNPFMDGVIPGKHSAVIPSKDGTFTRPVGSSVGGGTVCVFLLGVRSNSPLGIFSPNFKPISEHFRTMITDLEQNAEKWGFLGSSAYTNTSDRLVQPEILNIMYFKSAAYLHAFAHGKAHRTAWDWFVRNEGRNRNISISHEMFEAPAGAWETIYANYCPSNFAATRHLIEQKDGSKAWVSPLVRGDHAALRTSASRMGWVKDPAGKGGEMGEQHS